MMMNNLTPIDQHKDGPGDCLDRLVERLETVRSLLVLTVDENGLIEIDSSDISPGGKAHLSLALQAHLIDEMTEQY